VRVIVSPACGKVDAAQERYVVGGVPGVPDGEDFWW
jgi:hypothetical protein